MSIQVTARRVWLRADSRCSETPGSKHPIRLKNSSFLDAGKEGSRKRGGRKGRGNRELYTEERERKKSEKKGLKECVEGIGQIP